MAHPTPPPGPEADPLRWRKLWHPALLNSWQYLALVGLVMTAAAHALLQLTARVVPGFSYLYLVWTVVFILGAIRNATHIPHPDDHDHHDHHH